MSKTRWISSGCRDDGVESEGGEVETETVTTRRVEDRAMISLVAVEQRERGSIRSLKAGISVMIRSEDSDLFNREKRRLEFLSLWYELWMNGSRVREWR